MTYGPCPPHRKPIIEGEIARIPLTRGLFAIIDAADVDLVKTRRWCAVTSSTAAGYYAQTSLGPGRSIGLHRFLLNPPAGSKVDHANHNTLDNRRANLRLADAIDNNRNRRAARSDSTTGYIGVSPGPEGGWRARAQIAGERFSLGIYPTPEEAARARDDFIRTNHPSEFWTFNFPLPGERGINREEVPA